MSKRKQCQAEKSINRFCYVFYLSDVFSKFIDKKNAVHRHCVSEVGYLLSITSTLTGYLFDFIFIMARIQPVSHHFINSRSAALNMCWNRRRGSTFNPSTENWLDVDVHVQRSKLKMTKRSYISKEANE